MSLQGHNARGIHAVRRTQSVARMQDNGIRLVQVAYRRLALSSPTGAAPWALSRAVPSPRIVSRARVPQRDGISPGDRGIDRAAC